MYKIKSIINQERPKNEIKPAEKKELDISKSIITNIDTSKFDQSIFGQKLPSVQLAGESVLFGNQKGISTVPNSSY